VINRRIGTLVPAVFGLDGFAGGGLMYKPTPFKSKFTLTQTTFRSNENIVVQAFCDNTKCDCHVKSFKFKLLRKSSFMINNKIYHTTEYIYEVKIPGAPAKESVTRYYTIPIPRFEKDKKTLFASSITTKLYCV
jgi:hypothetical protein